jgi:cobalamin biosynthesis protein CobD/CbiB
MFEAVEKLCMEHPVQYVARVTKFLDRLIQDYGDYLFVGFAFFCIVLISWIVSRRRKHPVHDISVVILPLGQAPKRDCEPQPLLFDDQRDF